MGGAKGPSFLLLVSLCFSAIVASYMYIRTVEIYNQKTPRPLYNKNPQSVFHPPAYKRQTILEIKPVVSPAKVSSNKRNPIDLNHVTTAATMSASVVNPKTVYQVGETLIVKIVARDANGRPKSFGEDFLLAKLHTKSPTEACTSGKITDYGNGIYLATFLLPLSGNFSVSVILVHPSEAIQILKRIHDTYSDVRNTWCQFSDQKANISEWTKCGFYPNYKIDPEEVCDFSKPGPNATWYCGRPKGIACETIMKCINNETADHALVEELVTPDEAQLFTRYQVNQEVPNDIRITVQNKGSHLGPPKMEGRPLPTCGPRLPKTTSEGYWYNKTWTSLRCQSSHFSPSPATYKCLKNKTFYLFGDSTARQYKDYLNELVDKMNAQLPNDVKKTEDIHDSIKVNFEFHNYPRTHPTNNAMGGKYAVDIIDGLVGGPDVVIIFSIWAHYTAVHIETFRARVYGIRNAIERLHAKYPDTKVIWRTGNMRGHAGLLYYLFYNNWYAYQLVLEAKRILGGLDIYVMDVWDMSVCTTYVVHPFPHVIKNHLDLVFSFICQD
ncbi:NXPE family member 3-like [Branchiostoma floridae x Branchiostoma belcheri]